MKKRMLALILALVLLLSLTACNGNYMKKEGGVKTYTFISSYVEDEITLPGDFDYNTMDPREIYDSITYTEEMFYGSYRLAGDYDKWAKEAEKAAKDMDTFEMPNWPYADYSYNYAVIPMGFEAGPTQFYASERFPDIEVANVSFFRAGSDYLTSYYCAYEVEGNTITFIPLANYEHIYEKDADGNSIFVDTIYELSDMELSYEFRFDGIHLTLSNGSESITLTCKDFADTYDDYRSIGGYLRAGSDKLDGMDRFSGTQVDGMTDILFLDQASFYLVEGEYNVYEAAKLYEDGRITLYWESYDEHYDLVDTHLHHMVFIGTDPMILTDGENFYYYTESYSGYNSAQLGDSLSEADKEAFGELSEDAQEAIVDKKEELLDNMDTSYAESGLNVNVDKTTGEINMDATVLFDVDQSTISEEGKAFLREFVKVYANVALSSDYDGFLSKIVVEGHTDPTGNYDYNLSLSQARAEAVMNFCLSAESGLSEAEIQTLASLLEAVGYSSDKPVLDENGDVDNDASRRVSFRFIISIK